jgi:hypothetical protein
MTEKKEKRPTFYTTRAQDCESAAEPAVDSTLRQTYRDIARQWREMADHATNWIGLITRAGRKGEAVCDDGESALPAALVRVAWADLCTQLQLEPYRRLDLAGSLMTRGSCIALF